MEVIGLDQIEDALSDLKIVEKSVIKVEHCFSFMTYVLNIPIKVKVNKINIKRYCHLCLFVYINIDINTLTHTQTHTHAHIHTHTHTHTHTQIDICGKTLINSEKFLLVFDNF